MTALFDQIQAARAAIEARLGGRRPRVALVLGSGLGPFADRLESAVTIPYADIPEFPRSTVAGHAGRLVIGDAGGVTCVAMQGRVHTYEGHPAARVAFPARVMIALGARTLIVTNASGGVRPSFEPGTLMLLADHLNLLGDNPLRGENDERLGPRFPDMSHAYAPELRRIARDAAARLGFELAEGVYAALPGPTYETPAEVRMLATLGADAVGMSTVPETIVANHMGARVLGISCITNKAAGLSATPLSHEEVTTTATAIRTRFEQLLTAVITAIGAEEPRP